MPNLLYCYDIEVLPNYFCVTFVDLKTRKERHVFIISPWRNDLHALIPFLRQDGLKLVGFNNIGYDYPVIHILLDDDLLSLDSSELNEMIYDRSGEVLTEDWKKDYDRFLIPQRDLFRVWHFNNKAKYTSLKYLQINMDWPDARESNIHYQQPIKQGAEEDTFLSYNLNDVLSTIAFYDLSKDKLRMRAALGAKYKRDFGNFPDTRIGEAIFLSVMSNLTGRSQKELSSRRTHRKKIVLNDAIPEGVYFASDQFGSVLKYFKEQVITNTKSKEKFSVYYDGVKYDFGLGGLHALRESGVYKNLDSADVGGYYPSLSISKRIYPEHLGEAFCDAHQVIKDERKMYEKGTMESDGLKLAGNGVFGMTNAEWSPFYDPLCTMKTTIGGQLLLAQLCEWITMSGAGRIIMSNTDGFEVEILNRKKYEKMCDLWQKTHKLSLEFSKYKTLAIRDVNNYIGVKDNDKVKEKGDYVIKPEIYKDQSMKIVRYAVKEYFVNGTPVEKTINESQDIKLFVMGKRARTGNLEWRKALNLTELIRETLPKNVRYYVSKSGGNIVKVLAAQAENSKKNKVVEIPNQTDMFNNVKTKKKVEKKHRIVGIHKGWRVTMFNKWVDKPFEDYGIEKQFYINEAKKLIDPILKTQTRY